MSARHIGTVITFALALVAALGTSTAAQTSVEGEWDVTFTNTEGYTINSGTMRIAQDGTSVTGTMDTDEGFAELEGSIQGNQLDYVVTVNDEGHVLEWTVLGSVDGEEMHGTFDGEETGKGDWVAIRVP